jgi:hypothetical protein
MTAEYSETSTRKSRGRPPGLSRKSLDLIEAMREVAEAAQPITGRGVGYQLFTRGLIDGMHKMPMVYRLLKEARERNMIAWDWIVDETHELEIATTWSNPAAFVRTVRRSYRRNFWRQQPQRVEVWSEKGTVRGLLKPVLDNYGVGFRVMHGFGSATDIYNIAQHDDGRPLIVIYVGDWDPSGLCMSEHDLPARLSRYGGDHVEIRRIAIVEEDHGLPSFPASDKKKDPRYPWFVENFGDRAWELDAMDPRDLRDRVEQAIQAEIDWDAWNRCETVQRAEQESLQTVLDAWGTS